MPRRDLTEERTHQILDAFETCILRHGLESSSLERVAEEAGVKRPLIRHYIGNREALVLALARRFVENYRAQVVAMFEQLGDSDRMDKLLSSLFSSRHGDGAESVLIFENLILEATKQPDVRDLLSGWTSEFVGMVRDELLRHAPDASGHEEVAWGIVSIYYNHVSLMPLGLKRSLFRGSRKAAWRLVDSLESAS